MSMVEIPDPPGYRVVGYGCPCKGKPFVSASGKVVVAHFDFEIEGYSYPLLEPVEVWRDATIDDLRRVPLKCRVRDDEQEPWVPKELRGGCIVPSGKWKWITDGLQWIHCQVLEEEPCLANAS